MKTVFNKILLIVIFLIFILNSGIAFSSGYPHVLEEELNTLLIQNAHDPSNPARLVRISELYLDMGDDFYIETSERISAYHTGAKVAEEALGLNNNNSRAHFFYAANLGSAAQLKGLFASVFTINKLKFHVDKALELEGDFPPALHMKGMLLYKLPWVLGGSASDALEYLEKAVQINPGYTSARLDLAKAYMELRHFTAARRELHVVLISPDPLKKVIWEKRYRPEAEKLLLELERNNTAGPPSP